MANPPSIQAGSTLSHLAEGSLAARGVDIIFIHALLGNTCGTWTTTEQKGKSQTANRWLWDLLPADLPSSRIYTYGCRPKALCHDWDIHKVADQLLVELTDLRADKAERHGPRPILFVSHSLGGLVVKCALIKAFDNRGDEALNDIVAATKGIIFLGTPHTSSTSELSTVISRISFESELSNVAMLALQSFRQIALRFLNLPWGSLPWKIVSFHEGLPLPGTNVLAVDRSQTKLWTFPQVSLHKNHHDMCRFSSDDDPSYVTVVESLRSIILVPKCPDSDQTAAPQNRSQQEHEVLKSLAFEDASRYIPDPHPATLGWVFGDASTFKSWLDPLEKSSGLYWIHGKPGSGKSTLMKYIANNITRCGPLGRAKSHTLSTHFFFSQHGANQSFGSLLKSLVYQLLSSMSGYPSPEIFAKLAGRREFLGTENPWGNEELTESLFHLVEKSTARGESLYVVIDALDECDDRDSLVSLLERLDTSSYPQRTIWTCVSSRYSPSSIRFVPAWEMRLEDYNSSDIQNYTTAKLLERSKSLYSALEAQELAQVLAEQARGVFLWATLAVSHLLDVSYRKATKLDEQQLIDLLLPTDLGKAFETIMGRIESSRDTLHRGIAHDALSLVLHSRRPLSALELRDALAESDNGHDYQNAERATQQDSATRLCMLCGGFLVSSSQVVNSGDGRKTLQEPTIQVIHKSVRQFLLDKGNEAESHFQIARTCLGYVHRSSVNLQSAAASSYNFRGYAITYGMQHLSLAGKMGLTPKSPDIQHSPLFQTGFIDRWVHLHKKQFHTQNLFKPGKTTAAHVMAYFDISCFDTGLWGVSNTDIDAQDHFGRTPLLFAAAMGHRDTCSALICRGADVSHKDAVYGQSPLQLAAAHGHGEVVRLLIETGRVDPNIKSGGSALHMAARLGYLQVARLLLEAGADPEIANTHTGETPLSQAAALGHIPLVSLLLQSGAKVEHGDNRGWTPLHHAVKHGRKRTIDVLLRNLTQHQLRTLRVNLGKAEYSWVSTVLRAILACLCLRQCGQSQAPSSDSPQESKAPTAPVGNRACATSDNQPGKHKLDPDSEEDDCEEKHHGPPKKQRPLGPSGRRFACPYFRKNATKYAKCNKTGFQNIYRVKSHIKDHHSGMFNWPRCHTCRDRFPPDDILDHKPCVKRDEPVDYDEGYDPFQYEKLTSKATFPKHSTPEKCWNAIFKVLFPDWPADTATPNPYQDGQDQKVSAQEAIKVTHDMLRSPEIIREILSNARSGQGEQALQQTFDRLFGELGSRFELHPNAANQQPQLAPEPNPQLAPRPLSDILPSIPPAPNTAPSLDVFQPPLNRLTMEAAYAQMANPQPLWNNEDTGYLPPSDWNSFNYDNGSTFDYHSRAISSSGAPSAISFYYSSIPDISEAVTDNTNLSDYNSAGQRGWARDIGTDIPQLLQQTAAGLASSQHQTPPSTRPAPGSTTANFSTTDFTFRMGGRGSYQNVATSDFIGRSSAGVTSPASQLQQQPGNGMQNVAKYGQVHEEVCRSGKPHLSAAGPSGDRAEQDLITITDPSLADPEYGQ